jgi:hypothetical protein
VGNLGELPSRGALDVCQTENESVIEIVWTTKLEPWPVVICKGVAAKPPLKMGPAMYVTTMARALTYGYGNSSESKSLNPPCYYPITDLCWVVCGVPLARIGRDLSQGMGFGISPAVPYKRQAHLPS